MTRTDDETVALDERTKRALQCNKAALLVSLHVNSSTDRTISGVETFYHKPQLFNDESECGISPVMKHSIDSHDMCYYEESKKLGTVLHKTLVSDTNLFLIKDRGVHSKVSQLLLGAHVPSVLIEMGYLTNDDERKNLVTAQHQQELALRIVKGIELYLDEYLIA